jgi:cell division protein FtsL
MELTNNKLSLLHRYPRESLFVLLITCVMVLSGVIISLYTKMIDVYSVNNEKLLQALNNSTNAINNSTEAINTSNQYLNQLNTYFLTKDDLRKK